MKKVLMTLVTVALILTCVFAFVACKKPDIKDADTAGYGEGNPDPAIVGTEIVPVSDAMKADGEAMFLNAVANYEKSNYTSAWLVGQVDTVVLGINVSQMVDALRIRDHGNQYMYNNSYTKDGKFPNIRLMDNYYYDAATQKTKLLATSDKKNAIFYDGKLTAKKWVVEEDFATAEDFMKVNPNDPRVLNMYDLNADTVTEVGTPEVKTTESGATYYAFHVKCDALNAFKPYLPVMLYMLEQQLGEGKATIYEDDTMGLQFDVEIWENGLFKGYDVTEDYNMNVFKIVDGSIQLNSHVYFNYDNTKEPISKYYADDAFIAKTQLAPAKAKDGDTSQ